MTSACRLVSFWAGCAAATAYGKAETDAPRTKASTEMNLRFARLILLVLLLLFCRRNNWPAASDVTFAVERTLWCHSDLRWLVNSELHTERGPDAGSALIYVKAAMKTLSQLASIVTGVFPRHLLEPAPGQIVSLRGCYSSGV